MKYISYYNSPLGKILLASDEIGLFGAWFENSMNKVVLLTIREFDIAVLSAITAISFVQNLF